MKTYQIPEEPEEGTRVIGESSRVLYTNTGGWSGAWKGEDGSEYEWVELLENEGSVKELVAPVESVKWLRERGYADDAPLAHHEHIRALIEFAEAFA